MRVMTYNVHRCTGRDGIRSCFRTAAVIAQACPDVVALQEVGVHSSHAKETDQAREMASLLKMNYFFHPVCTKRDGEFGIAVLSRHPISLVQAGPLPSGIPGLPSEPRGALWVRVHSPDGDWDVVNTHFGLGPVERRQQARALAGSDWCGRLTQNGRAVVCGDLNSRPGSNAHSIVTRQLRDAFRRHRNTFATSLPWACVDHIFTTPDIFVESTGRVDVPGVTAASDHFPLVADLLAD